MSPILQGLANGSVRGYGGYLPLGPSSAFDSIATANGTGSSATISFSSIPQNYHSLQLRIYAQVTSTATRPRLQFNGDTAANYASHRLIGTGTATAASFQASQTYIELGALISDTSSYYSSFIIDLHDYTNTSINKTIRHFSGNPNASQGVAIGSGLWVSTSAITSIDIKVGTGNFSSTTVAALYGIKGA